MTETTSKTLPPVQVVAVTGPTATGKTALAVALAEAFHGEIISVDSRQVYRGMDLGTGKDLEEYGAIPYHLIDVADPAEGAYNLSAFCRDAFDAIAAIRGRGCLPILCGGTALYLEALLLGFRLPGGKLAPRQAGVPRARQVREGEASFCPPFPLNALTLGVLYPRAEVRRRIEVRLDARFAAGMCEEVRRLHDSGVPWERLEFYGLEYREIARHLQGFCTFEEMRNTLLDRIRQFAKRQDIFFRKMEREGIPIHWLPQGDFKSADALIRDFLAGTPLLPPGFRLCDHPNPSKGTAELP